MFFWKAPAPQFGSIWLSFCVFFRSLWSVGLDEEAVRMIAATLPNCINLKNLILDNNPIPTSIYEVLLYEENSKYDSIFSISRLLLNHGILALLKRKVWNSVLFIFSWIRVPSYLFADSTTELFFYFSYLVISKIGE